MSEISVVGSRMFESNNNDMAIKVLLADDSEVVRRGIRQLLASRAEIKLVGEAADYAQTIRLAKDLSPRVVILDLHMPDQKSISPQEIKLNLNHTSHVLAISIWNDEESRELAERLGAAVLLDKMNLGSDLIPAIIELEHGHRVTC
jgi:DNA-binding NarL/FixJ family response regulator